MYYFSQPGTTSMAVTTSPELTTTGIEAVTIISATHYKECDVDINTQVSDTRQLKQSLTNVILDDNNSTCIGLFEFGERQLQATFLIPGQWNQLLLILVGHFLNCQEPFIVVYTGMCLTGVKKQQCVLSDYKTPNSATGRIVCHFECSIGACQESRIQITALFESHMWKASNQPTAQLCVVFYTLTDEWIM